jgi:hypothetical protein
MKEELLYLKEQTLGYRGYNGALGCGKDMIRGLTIRLWSSRMAASSSSGKGRERERECWEGLGVVASTVMAKWFLEAVPLEMRLRKMRIFGMRSYI